MNVWLTTLFFGIAWMVLGYLLARIISHYSIVDLFWSAGLGLVAASLLATGKIQTFDVAIALIIWSLRLSSHLWTRIRRVFPLEDRRYARFLTNWGENSGAKFFVLFLTQGFLFPVLLAPLFGEVLPDVAQIPLMAGRVLFIVALLGETVADRQLAAFHVQFRSTPGMVCNIGLWKYSRHPNYFFEWLNWLAFSAMGFALTGELYGFLAPLIMFLLLNFVTGVPPAEEQSLISRGDAYRMYQKRTSRFFPWFPIRQSTKNEVRL